MSAARPPPPRPMLGSTRPVTVGAGGVSGSSAAPSAAVSVANSVAASPTASKAGTPQRRVSPPSSAGPSGGAPRPPPAPFVSQQSFRQPPTHTRKGSSVDFSLMRKVFDEIDTDKSNKIDETELLQGLQKLGVSVTTQQLKRIAKAFRKSELRRGHKTNLPGLGLNQKPMGFGADAKDAGDGKSGGGAAGGGTGPGLGGRPDPRAAMLQRGDTKRNLLMLGAKQPTTSNLFAAIVAAEKEKPPPEKWELDFNEFKRFVAFSEQDEKKDHIKVAVRMRPFSDREKRFGSKSCVSMDDGLTTVSNPLASGKTKQFDMDYTYDSSRPGDHFYAHQRFVCQEMVSDILDEALQGFNCTVFAYGQTGAGKSYTMFGDQLDKPLSAVDPSRDFRGIIPHFCQQLFAYTTRDGREKDESYKIFASMLEIYNDKVRDLGNPMGAKDDLKIRNHPETGAYVANLTLNPIDGYDDAMKLISEGLAQRTESATIMNHASSRAHTIFSLTIKKTALSDDLFDSAGNAKLITTVSKINLVDLAGSERVKQTKAASAAHHDPIPGKPQLGKPLSAAQLAKTKKQVEEGINVNKSLTVLGKCILALTQRASGNKIHVPFRDSTLTFLLKESLQGNSRTFMFANISPSASEFEQTMSTLRFAQLAQSLRTKAVVNNANNNDEQVKLKLKTEIERLRKSMLEKKLQDAEYESMNKQLHDDEQVLQDVVAQTTATSSSADSDAKLKAEQQALQEARNKAAAEREAKLAKRKTAPHLLMLSDDALTSERIAHFLDHASVRVCRDDPTTQPPPGPNDIALGGLQIVSEHATITNSDPHAPVHASLANLVIVPGSSAAPMTTSGGGSHGGGGGGGGTAVARVTVNGTQIKGATPLTHNDRVIFGAMAPGHVFRVVHPAVAFRLAREKGVSFDDKEGMARLADEDHKFDFEFAAKELAEAAFSPALKAKAAEEKRLADLKAREYELKLKELEDKLAEEKRRAEEQLRAKDTQLALTLEEVERQQNAALAQARAELAKLGANADAKTRAEYEKKLRDREAEFAAKRRQAELHAHKQQEEIRLKQQEVERLLLLKQKEETERRTRAEAEAFAHAEFQDLLIRLIPLVAEANAIADELKQDRVFQIRPVVNTMDYDLHDIQSRVRVEAKTRPDSKTPFTALWTYGMFLERIYMMKELYNSWQEHARVPIHCQSVDDNPFYFDTDEPEPIGSAKVFLQSLYHLLDIKENYKILNLFGEPAGHVIVEIAPVMPKPDQEFFDEDCVTELFEKRKDLSLRLSIVKAMGIPDRLSTNTFATYRFWDDATDQATDACVGTSTNPLWPTHKRLIKLAVVSSEFCKYVKDDTMKVTLWGYPMPRDPNVLLAEQWIGGTAPTGANGTAAGAAGGMAPNFVIGADGGILSVKSRHAAAAVGGAAAGTGTGGAITITHVNVNASPMLPSIGIDVKSPAPVTPQQPQPGTFLQLSGGALSPSNAALLASGKGGIDATVALTPRKKKDDDDDDDKPETEEDAADLKKLAEADRARGVQDDAVAKRSAQAIKSMARQALVPASMRSPPAGAPAMIKERPSVIVPGTSGQTESDGDDTGSATDKKYGDRPVSAKLAAATSTGTASVKGSGGAATTTTTDGDTIVVQRVTHGSSPPTADEKYGGGGAGGSANPGALPGMALDGTASVTRKSPGGSLLPRIPSALPNPNASPQLTASGSSNGLGSVRKPQPANGDVSGGNNGVDDLKTLPDSVEELVGLIPNAPVKSKLSSVLAERDKLRSAEHARTESKWKDEADRQRTEKEQTKKAWDDAIEQQVAEMKRLRESLAARDKEIATLNEKLKAAPPPPPPAPKSSCVIL